jgi:hypothetical protein
VRISEVLPAPFADDGDDCTDFDRDAVDGLRVAGNTQR